MLHSRLHGNTESAEAGKRDLLETYPEVLTILLRKYATYEITYEANGMSPFFARARTWQKRCAASTYGIKASRCCTRIFGNRLESLFVEIRFLSTWPQVCNYLVTHSVLEYPVVARFAQTIDETNRSVQTPAITLPSPQVTFNGLQDSSVTQEQGSFCRLSPYPTSRRQAI